MEDPSIPGVGANLPVPNCASLVCIKYPVRNMDNAVATLGGITIRQVVAETTSRVPDIKTVSCGGGIREKIVACMLSRVSLTEDRVSEAGKRRQWQRREEDLDVSGTLK